MACLDTIRLIGADPVKELLVSGNQARLEGRWDQAADDFLRAAERANRLDLLYTSNDSLRGLARMHQGALHHTRGDLATAISFYQEAFEALQYDRHNRAAAQYALGVAYLRRGETAKANDLIPAALAVLTMTAARGAATARWEKIRQGAAGKPPPAGPNPPPEPPDPLPPNRAPLPAPPDPAAPDLGFIAFLALLALVAFLLGGGVILLAGGLSFLPRYFLIVLATFLVVVPGLLLFMMRRQPDSAIPYQCAAVIERMTIPRVVYGPQSLSLWPSFDRLKAIVPLYGLQYTTPKQRILVSSTLTVEVSAVVHYGIGGEDDQARRQNINHAIYRLPVETRLARSATGPSGGLKPEVSLPDLRRSWERRLLTDVQMTLNAILPGRRFEDITCDRCNQRATLCADLRDHLTERTREWGVQIQEVSLLEVAKVKA